VAAQFDSALLQRNTPIRRGNELTNWYKYQRRTVIQRIDPEIEISETSVFGSELTRLIIKLKNNDPIGNRTRDLPAFSIAPQPSTLF
jgi:hypothetical protein